DFVWVLGPSEGFRVIVGFDEKAVDRRLKLDDGSEHAAFEAPLGQFGKEAFDRVEPGCGSWGEVERPTWMPGQPSPYLWMLVGSVVVGDGMDQLAGRDGRFDGIEEADELLMPMALHAAADHLAIQYVECSEQRCRAMPDVIVGHSAAAASFHRQAGLRAIECLDLALFIDRQHDRVHRWIDIEADDLAQLGGEPRIIR